MTLSDVKAYNRTQIKVVPGGPAVGTVGSNRAQGALNALDKVAEFAAEQTSPPLTAFELTPDYFECSPALVALGVAKLVWLPPNGILTIPVAGTFTGNLLTVTNRPLDGSTLAYIDAAGEVVPVPTNQPGPRINITLAQTNSMLNADPPVLAWREYAITGKWNAAATDTTVYVAGLRDNAWAGSGWVFNDDEKAVPVLVDVQAKTWVPFLQENDLILVFLPSNELEKFPVSYAADAFAAPAKSIIRIQANNFELPDVLQFQRNTSVAVDLQVFCGGATLRPNFNGSSFYLGQQRGFITFFAGLLDVTERALQFNAKEYVGGTYKFVQCGFLNTSATPQSNNVLIGNSATVILEDCPVAAGIVFELESYQASGQPLTRGKLILRGTTPGTIGSGPTDIWPVGTIDERSQKSGLVAYNYQFVNFTGVVPREITLPASQLNAVNRFDTGVNTVVYLPAPTAANLGATIVLEHISASGSNTFLARFLSFGSFQGSLQELELKTGERVELAIVLQGSKYLYAVRSYSAVQQPLGGLFRGPYAGGVHYYPNDQVVAPGGTVVYAKAEISYSSTAYDASQWTALPGGTGGGGTSGAPQWIAGAQTEGALVYDAGYVYRVKQNIANSQSAPGGNAANYLLIGPGGSGGTPAPVNSIDYANPITLTGPATLEVNKAYYVTGSGYALTLPSASVGAAIFVQIASAATGLYPISGAGTLALYANETMSVRKTAEGWKRTGGELLAMSAELISGLNNQAALVVNAGNTPPTTIQNYRNGPAGLVDAPNARLVVQRAGRVTVSGSVFLKDAQPGAFYQLSISVGSKFNTTAIPVTNIGLGVNVVTLTADAAAGDAVTMSIYATAGGNYRGQYSGSEAHLSLVELL